MKSPHRTLHYIEAFDHFELLERWLPTLACLQNWQITCHLGETYRRSFAARYVDTSTTFTGPRSSTHWAHYLQTLTFDIEDVVVIATIGRRPRYFLPLIGRVRYYLVLHNLNYCFNQSNDRDLSSIRPAWYSLLNRINQPTLRRLLHGASGYLYPSPDLQQVGGSRCLDNHIQHYVVPFSAQSSVPSAEEKIHAPLRIVVPGAVNSCTKDYTLLRELLRKLAEYKLAATIYLAGRVSDQRTIRALLRVAATANRRHQGALTLQCYPDGLSPTAFANLLTEADVLLAPLRRTVSVGGYRETIGLTKVSGSIYDAVYFGKPIFVPSWYTQTEVQLCRFEDVDHLISQFKVIIDRGSLPQATYPTHTNRVLHDSWLAVLEGSSAEQPP